jgi:hypothetical protein
MLYLKEISKLANYLTTFFLNKNSCPQSHFFRKQIEEIMLSRSRT